MNSKKTRFNERVTVIKIPSYRDFTLKQRLSIWYTDKDYAIKNPVESRLMKIETIQRIRRIKVIRRLVLYRAAQLLFAQQRKHPIQNNNVLLLDDNKQELLHSECLARFCHHRSAPCVLAARHRAVKSRFYVKLEQQSHRSVFMITNISFVENRWNANHRSNYSSNGKIGNIVL